MSYILEALKKSERERARGRIPTLETVSNQGVSQKSLWLGVLLGAGALLLAAFVAIWVLEPRFSQPSGLAENPNTPKVSGERQAAIAANEPRPEVSVEIRETGAAEPGAESPAVAPRRVAAVDELEPGVRQRVRDLSVNVVSYSDVPERRFVMFNQRIVRESETVGDGIVVKRITPEGALLSVGGYEILVRPD